MQKPFKIRCDALLHTNILHNTKITHSKNIIIMKIPQFYLEAYVKIQSTQFFYDNVQHDHAQDQKMFLNK